MPATSAFETSGEITWLPDRVVAALESVPVRVGRNDARARARPQYSREEIRRALRAGARSPDISPERRQRFLHALGEFESFLLDRDARVEALFQEIKTAKVHSPAGREWLQEVLRPPRRRRAVRGLGAAGSLLGFLVLILGRGPALVDALDEVNFWMFLLAAWLFYLVFDRITVGVLALAGRGARRSGGWRLALPLALTVVLHVILLVVAFNLTLPPVIEAPASFF